MVTKLVANKLFRQ